MRKIVILSAVIIGLISVFMLFIFRPISNQQSSFTSEGPVLLDDKVPIFNTYENNIYGLSIEYPSLWLKVEFGKDNLIASFVSNPRNESGLLENVMLEAIRLPYYNETTLNDIARNELLIYKSKFPDFHFLSSTSNITNSGIPVLDIVYSHTKDRLHISTMETFAIHENNVYKIIFSADTPEYKSFLPTVEKMVDSFNFNFPKQALKLAHA